MKNAINLEKAIFRYRIHVIKDMASKTLKEMRENSNNLYDKLEDWTNYTFKIENDAVDTMANIFKDAIEN